MNTKDLVERDGIRAESLHLGLREGDDWLHDEWEVTLWRGETAMRTPYKTGIGHRSKRPAREAEWNKKDRRLFVAGRAKADPWIYDKPQPPEAADVLDCLLSDSSGTLDDFEAWCGDYGYDTDSRKAFESFTQCQQAKSTLRRFLGPKFDEYMEAERL